MQNKLILRIAAVLSAFILAGCSTDISVTLPPSKNSPASSSRTTAGTTVPETSETSELSVQPETTPQETPEETTEALVTREEPAVETVLSDEQATETYKNYVLTDDDKEFISKCVFVGDSICRGLEAYDIIPNDNVLAVGNVAARNIFDFTFKLSGSEMSLLSALVDLKPQYIVFSMGMNDVNMTSQQKFCENYGDLLSQVQVFLPDSQLIVCSVTPIIYTSRFTSNANIDSFNTALKEYLDSTNKWIYVDITHELKNSLNALKSQYDGGDGVHLAGAAYYAILYQICERMVSGLIYENGELVPIVTSSEDGPDTTVSPSESSSESNETVTADDADFVIPAGE